LLAALVSPEDVLFRNEGMSDDRVGESSAAHAGRKDCCYLAAGRPRNRTDP
jgi:hypothetical protein